MKTREPMPPKLRLVDAAFMAEHARAMATRPVRAVRRPAAEGMLLARLDAIELKLAKFRPGVPWHDVAGLALLVGTAAHLGLLTGRVFF